MHFSLFKGIPDFENFPALIFLKGDGCYPPEQMPKKVFLPFILDNGYKKPALGKTFFLFVVTLPGAPPTKRKSPVVIVLIYLYAVAEKFPVQVIQGIALTTPTILAGLFQMCLELGAFSHRRVFDLWPTRFGTLLAYTSRLGLLTGYRLLQEV